MGMHPDAKILLDLVAARGGATLSGNRDLWSELVHHHGEWRFRQGETHGDRVSEAPLTTDEVLSHLSSAAGEASEPPDWSNVLAHWL